MISEIDLKYKKNFYWIARMDIFLEKVDILCHFGSRNNLLIFLENFLWMNSLGYKSFQSKRKKNEL